MSEEVENAGLAFRGPGEAKWRDLTIAGDGESQDVLELAKADLKATLLSSLQMQHLVVLAGSGCSLSAGGPSMGDLWVGAVGEEPDERTKAISERVNHPLEERDIEVFLSRVEAYLQVKEDEDVSLFLNESKSTILKLCTEFLDPDKLGAHETFLHRLSRRRVRDQRLKVFTTNYDLCFERAASMLGGVALDGFSFTVPRRYDPTYFDYDIVRRPKGGDDHSSFLEGVFLLYKLHGSVNWARKSGGRISEEAKPSPEEACLIYPARGKYQQSFAQPHLESVAQYLASLREPNTCVLVVGFGFNDDHLSEPLLAAIKANPHLRVVIADPGSREKASNENKHTYWAELSTLSEWGEDVWFVTASFPEFAPMIPDLKALTPASRLAKAVQDVSEGGRG